MDEKVKSKRIMRILYLPSSLSQQRQFEKKNVNIYPVLMAMQAQWYKNNGHQVFWKEIPEDLFIDGMLLNVDKVVKSPESLTFSMLPHPDRVWTRAKEYTSGNYKFLPGTHIMSASGCWWGKCTFCVEKNKGMYGTNIQEVRPVEDVISEIEECRKLGFKEVFDDSATFPQGEWFNRFCNSLSHIDGIRFSCNMRICDCDFNKFRKAGGRMVLFGIESANQETLNKINKGVKIEDIIPTIKKASDAGIEAHGAFMFGYPWESDEDAIKTLRLVHYLLRKGYLKTAQASFFCQPDCKSNESQRHFVKDIYKVWKYPDFWFHQITDIKNKDDLKYLWRKIKAGLVGG
jgi:radical SAM superfamily enzyme YgiQ (UPF0313 family)